MPDIQVEKEDKFKKLKPSEREELASTISGWWESFHNKRQSQIATAQQLMKYVYLNQADRNKTAAWKSNIKENKIYTTWDSMKAVMWKEIWSNEE
jgi:cytochrome b involved in lipid metabolism